MTKPTAGVRYEQKMERLAPMRRAIEAVFGAGERLSFEEIIQRVFPDGYNVKQERDCSAALKQMEYGPLDVTVCYTLMDDMDDEEEKP